MSQSREKIDRQFIKAVEKKYYEIGGLPVTVQALLTWKQPTIDKGEAEAVLALAQLLKDSRPKPGLEREVKDARGVYHIRAVERKGVWDVPRVNYR
jgi:hypothetical protein